MARRQERADAARNRRRILAAAAELFATRGDAVTMEEIALAARVGKGTLYHTHSLAQPVDLRLGQHNRHTPITHHRAVRPRTVFVGRGLWLGLLSGAL